MEYPRGHSETNPINIPKKLADTLDTETRVFEAKVVASVMPPVRRFIDSDVNQILRNVQRSSGYKSLRNMLPKQEGFDLAVKELIRYLLGMEGDVFKQDMNWNTVQEQFVTYIRTQGYQSTTSGYIANTVISQVNTEIGKVQAKGWTLG